MGRRKSVAEKANPKLPSDFFAHFVNQPLTNAISKYIYVEAFPIGDALSVGRYIDRAFGTVELCDLASQYWALYDRRNKIVQNHARTPESAPVITADGGYGRPREGIPVRIRTHTYVLHFSASSFYLADNYTRYDAHRPALLGMTDEDRITMVEIDAWVSRVLQRSREASEAEGFLGKARDAAGSTHALFRALPGLRGVLESLHIPLAEADQPYRGKDYFNVMSMDVRLPLWRTAWSEQYRPTLLKVAAAARAETAQTNYIPSGMYIQTLDSSD